jgi:hypothetical protein
MSSGQRVLICLLAGVVTFLIMLGAGLKPSGVTIGVVIGITAMVTQGFRNDKD